MIKTRYLVEKKSMISLKKNYQVKTIKRAKIKSNKMYNKNLTHPNLVKKSYRYRGTAPLTRIRTNKLTTILAVIIKVYDVE
jgi:hypothetical protein